MPLKRIQILIMIILISFANLACSADGSLPSSTPTIQFTPTSTPPPNYPAITSENVSELQELAVLGNGRINAFSIHPDDTFIALGGSLGIWILDYQSLEIIEHLPGHPGNITSLAFSPDGSVLASGGEDTTIRIWDMETYQLTQVLYGHTGTISALAWNHEGLVSGGEDKNLIVWDSQGFMEIYRIRPTGGEISDLAWNELGQLAIGDILGNLAILDWETRDLEIYRSHHQGWISSITWIPESNLIVTGSFDRSIHILDSATGTTIEQINNLSIVTAIAWDALNAQTLSAGGGPYTIKAWQAGVAESTYESDSFSSWIIDLQASHQNSEIVILTRNGELAIWDLRFNQIVRSTEGTGSQFTQRLSVLAWTPEGNQIIAGSADGGLYLWDIYQETIIAQFSEHQARITAIEWITDVNQFASGSQDGSVRIWDAQSSESLINLSGYNGPINDIALPPQGNYLISATSFGIAPIWETRSGHIDINLYADIEILSLDWGNHNQGVAIGTVDGQVQIWDPSSGLLISRVFFPNHQIGDLAWSPISNNLVVVGQRGQSGNAWVIDPTTNTRLFELENNSGGINAISWSPDGLLLAGAGNNGTIYLWNSQGDLIQILTSHQDAVSDISWQEDGTLFATASLDGTIRIWGILP